ncbi:hypothetical protein G3N18_03440 [Microbacterium sp. 2C]|uniref:hypothetical protein n=1 Tax=Microbacterium TaxID=33882 RepID=UPI0018C23BA9|nr:MULTISPECIES: hypothetical protein [Microbacterium]MBG0717141.1 hypothetical protein [Microbacterium paulum]
MYGYEPANDVARYAIQAPNDINRIYAGQQAWEVGFGIAPEQIPRITILNSGMSGLPMNPMTVSMEASLAGPLAVAAQIPASVDNHIDMMSDDLSVNGTSLRSVRELLHQMGKQ